MPTGRESGSAGLGRAPCGLVHLGLARARSRLRARRCAVTTRTRLRRHHFAIGPMRASKGRAPDPSRRASRSLNGRRGLDRREPRRRSPSAKSPPRQIPGKFRATRVTFGRSPLTCHGSRRVFEVGSTQRRGTSATPCSPRSAPFRHRRNQRRSGRRHRRPRPPPCSLRPRVRPSKRPSTLDYRPVRRCRSVGR